MNNSFDRSKHVFHSDAFAEIIKDTIRFFNGTPVHTLPPPENFVGAGVYALYYIGKCPYYRPLYDINRTSFSQPIYVGKPFRADGVRLVPRCRQTSCTRG